MTLEQKIAVNGESFSNAFYDVWFHSLFEWTLVLLMMKEGSILINRLGRGFPQPGQRELKLGINHLKRLKARGLSCSKFLSEIRQTTEKQWVSIFFHIPGWSQNQVMKKKSFLESTRRCFHSIDRNVLNLGPTEQLEAAAEKTLIISMFRDREKKTEKKKKQEKPFQP